MDSQLTTHHLLLRMKDLGGDGLGGRASTRLVFSAAAATSACTSAPAFTSTFTSSFTSPFSSALAATLTAAAPACVASATRVAVVVALLCGRTSASTTAAGLAAEAPAVSLAVSRGGTILSVLAAGALEALGPLRPLSSVGSVGSLRPLASLSTGVVVAASAATRVHPPTGSFRALASACAATAAALTVGLVFLATRRTSSNTSSRAGGSAFACDSGSLAVLPRLVGLGDLHVRVGAQALQRREALVDGALLLAQEARVAAEQRRLGCADIRREVPEKCRI